MDREKIIKGLECCAKDDCAINGDCPYGEEDADSCIERLSADALLLLKKQKAMRVLSQRECETLPNHYERKGFCPQCHQVVEWFLNRSYCGFCGQAVKWE